MNWDEGYEPISGHLSFLVPSEKGGLLKISWGLKREYCPEFGKIKYFWL